MKLRTTEEQYESLLTELRPVLERLPAAPAYVLQAEKRSVPGYRFQKKGQAVHISYGTRPDLCRGILAAGSSQDNEGEEVRCFQDFGYMMDCSRNAVPKVPTVKKLIRTLAVMGYQFLGLYLEDTIRVQEEPLLGYRRGAYSREEIREIVAYAEIFGMEVRPYVQTLAHFNQLTRYEHYRRFIDTDDILLIGDDRTYEFLDHYLGTIAEAFTSRTINIGMDEAHMVGLGKYLDSHGFVNRTELLQEHLKRVMELCRKYDLHPQMWSDMFFRLACGGEYYSEDLQEDIDIPEGLELIYWDYYSPDKDRYARMLRRHKRMTEHIGFAGGAWKWTGFTPHNRYSIEIGRAALAACRENGIGSVVITGWGDNGGEASTFSTLPALFADAEEAYENPCREKGDSGLPNEAFTCVTGMDFASYLQIDNGNPNTAEGKCVNNAGKFLLYNDPLLGMFDSLADQLSENYYEQAAAGLSELLQHCGSEEYAYLFRTQESLCRLLQQKAALGAEIHKAYAEKDRSRIREIACEVIPDILVQLDRFYQDFQTQWRRENKEYGFEVQSIRLGGLRQRLLDTGKRLRNFADGRVNTLEELEEAALPFSYVENAGLESLDYNLWSNIASPAVMG